MMADYSDEDAYAMFGSDEGEMTSSEDPSSSSLEASQNARRHTVSINTDHIQNSLHLDLDKSDDKITQPTTTESNQIKHLDNLHPANKLQLPWRPPLYLGPMTMVRCLIPFGGGRGYVASQALGPGTLLLVEEPIITWNVSETRTESGLNMLQHIVSADSAQQILNDMEHFYPTKLAIDQVKTTSDELSKIQVEEMMQELQNLYKDHLLLKECMELASHRGLTNSGGSKMDVRDFCRILLCIRYNSLESGIYLHAAMLNHSDSPNCVKFLPATGRAFSEVRTTRHVSAGEPLTISYIPRILSHASRRSYLFDQHRFDIGENLTPELLRMELIAGRLPGSSVEGPDRESSTFRVEQATSELRELYCETQNTQIDSEYIKGLEQAALELCSQAQEQLDSEHHLLLIPCHELHLDCCDLVQRKCSLSRTQQEGLQLRIVGTARKLVVLEEMFYGPDHFKLAGIYLDLTQAIEELLSQCPKRLVTAQHGLDSLSAWSALAHRARQEHNRVKALYPDNADKFITG